MEEIAIVKTEQITIRAKGQELVLTLEEAGNLCEALSALVGTKDRQLEELQKFLERLIEKVPIPYVAPMPVPYPMYQKPYPPWQQWGPSCQNSGQVTISQVG